MGWTEERVALLKKLWADGLSASQIAGRLGGITRNAVIGKVHRLGLARRATTSRLYGRRPRKPVVDIVTWRARNLAQMRAKLQELLPAAGDKAQKLGGEHVEQKPVALTPAELNTPKVLRVDLLDLKGGMCRWPIGDPHAAHFHFCGCKKASTSSYCEDHSRIAYQPYARRTRK